MYRRSLVTRLTAAVAPIVAVGWGKLKTTVSVYRPGTLPPGLDEP